MSCGEPVEPGITIRHASAISFQNLHPLDPHCSTGVGTMPWAKSIFEGLTEKVPGTGALVPCLATSWNISANWTYIDFFIREGIEFHNGDPLTASDVVYSFERAMDEDLGFAWGAEFRNLIDSAEEIGDYQVRVHLNAPYGHIADRCSEYFVIVPKDYIETEGLENFRENPVGTGPFKIVDWEQDVYVKLEAVKDHWRQPPDYDYLIIEVVPEDTTRMAMLQTGETDVAKVGAALIPSAEADPDLSLIASEYCYGLSIVFLDLLDRDDPESPVYNSPWQDARVREAVDYAIDRDGIADTLNGVYTPMGTFWAPYNTGYEYLEPPAYDPDQTISLLGDYCNSNNITWDPEGPPYGWEDLLWGDLYWYPGQRSVSEAIVAQLNEVGIEIVGSELEHMTYVQKMINGECLGLTTMTALFWSGMVNPAAASESMTIGLYAPLGRTYPELVEAWNDMAAATIEEDIISAAQAFEDLLFDLNWMTPMFAVNTMFAYGEHVGSWNPVPGWSYGVGFEYLDYVE